MIKSVTEDKKKKKDKKDKKEKKDKKGKKDDEDDDEENEANEPEAVVTAKPVAKAAKVEAKEEVVWFTDTSKEAQAGRMEKEFQEMKSVWPFLSFFEVLSPSFSF